LLTILYRIYLGMHLNWRKKENTWKAIDKITFFLNLSGMLLKSNNLEIYEGI
jgi:hypothetical protein